MTASRCSQVENADSPRNVAILRKSWRNASCVRSSASAVLPTIRRHSEYTRRLCKRYNRSKAAASPCWASRIASGFRNLAGFGSSRSGHATRGDASVTAMRRPSQKLHFQVLPAQLRGDRTGTRRPKRIYHARCIFFSRYAYFRPIRAARPVARLPRSNRCGRRATVTGSHHV